MALGRGLPVTHLGDPNWMDSGWKEQVGQPNDPMISPSGGPDGDRDFLKALKEVFDHEYEVRRPHQGLWDRAWERFNNRYDFARKREWQSKRGLPAIFILALRFAWEMTKVIEMAGEQWFESTTTQDPWRDLLDVPRDFVLDYLKSGGEDPENDFLTVFYDAMVGITLSEMAHILVMTENEGQLDYSPSEEDVFGDLDEPEEMEDLPRFGLFSGEPDGDEPPTVPESSHQFRLRFEAINPRFVLLDTSSSGNRYGYKMWYQSMTPWQFRAVGKQFGWTNIDEVVEAHNKGEQPRDNRSRDARERAESQPAKQKLIDVRHFFGTLPDENGEALFENGYMAWSGDFLLTEEPRDNPYWHQKIPIVSAGMIRTPWSHYHRSLLTMNLDPQEARVELLNMLLDYLHQTINPPTEIDWDQLGDSRGNTFRQGIAPGQVINTRKAGRNNPAISRAATPDIPSGVWQGLGFYKTEFSEGAALSDTGAMPRTRNRISAKEFSERQSASFGLWQQISRNIERNLIAPLLYQAYLVLLQKVPQPLWEAFVDRKLESKMQDLNQQQPPAPGTPPGQEAKPPEEPKVVKYLKRMRTWKARERFEKLGAAFRFKVTVYSVQESKREKLENMSMLVEMAQQIPWFAQRIKWHQVVRTVILASNEDPDLLLWADQGATQDRPMSVAESQGMGGVNPVSPVAPPQPGGFGG